MANSTQAGSLTLTLGLAVFATSFAGRLTDPLVLVLAQEFGAAPATVALLGTAYALPFALIQPILGPFGDAMGKQRVMLAGLWALVGMLLASAIATSLGLLFLARALSGAAAGGVFPLSLALIGDRVPLAGRQVAISRLLLASISGQAGGGALTGALEALVGWRGVMVVCALLTLGGALVLRAAARRAAPEPVQSLDARLAVRRYVALWRNPAAVVLFIAVCAEAVMVFGLFPYIAPLLASRGLGGPVEAGLVVGSFGLGGLVYAVLAPLLLRVLGQGRMVRWGGALAGLAFLVFALAPALPLFILAGLLLGTGFYMIHNSIQTRVTEIAPQARASATAMHAFCFFWGQALGVLVYGGVSSALGLEGTLLCCVAGALALGQWLGRRPPRQP